MEIFFLLRDLVASFQSVISKTRNKNSCGPRVFTWIVKTFCTITPRDGGDWRERDRVRNVLFMRPASLWFIGIRPKLPIHSFPGFFHSACFETRVSFLLDRFHGTFEFDIQSVRNLVAIVLYLFFFSFFFCSKDPCPLFGFLPGSLMWRDTLAPCVLVRYIPYFLISVW